MITKKEYNSRIKQYNTKIKIALEDNEKYDAIMYEQELKGFKFRNKTKLWANTKTIPK